METAAHSLSHCMCVWVFTSTFNLILESPYLQEKALQPCQQPLDLLSSHSCSGRARHLRRQAFHCDAWFSPPVRHCDIHKYAIRDSNTSAFQHIQSVTTKHPHSHSITIFMLHSCIAWLDNWIGYM